MMCNLLISISCLSYLSSFILAFFLLLFFFGLIFYLIFYIKSGNLSSISSGLIDFLVSSHPIALALREHVIFKILPMMNPDGVFLGNYR